MPQTAVQEQRTFLHAVFYPNGAEACAAVGLPPESQEVAETETAAIRQWLNDPRFAEERRRAIRYADWFGNALIAMKDARGYPSDVDHDVRVTSLAQTFVLAWRGLAFMQEA